jgi:integrase/recombinase XerD
LNDQRSGATPHEIMSWTGHQTLAEVERYTKATSRKKTADAAMAKLKG